MLLRLSLSLDPPNMSTINHNYSPAPSSTRCPLPLQRVITGFSLRPPPPGRLISSFPVPSSIHCHLPLQLAATNFSPHTPTLDFFLCHSSSPCLLPLIPTLPLPPLHPSSLHHSPTSPHTVTLALPAARPRFAWTRIHTNIVGKPTDGQIKQISFFKY